MSCSSTAFMRINQVPSRVKRSVATDSTVSWKWSSQIQLCLTWLNRPQLNTIKKKLKLFGAPLVNSSNLPPWLGSAVVVSQPPHTFAISARHLFSRRSLHAVTRPARTVSTRFAALRLLSRVRRSLPSAVCQPLIELLVIYDPTALRQRNRLLDFPYITFRRL